MSYYKCVLCGRHLALDAGRLPLCHGCGTSRWLIKIGEDEYESRLDR